MKKLLSLLLVIVLSAFMLTGCSFLLEDIDEDYAYEEDMTTQEEVLDEEYTDEETVDSDEVSLGVATDGTPFGDFSTTSVYGHEVTQDIFSEFELTMVNIWATWCPPCIGEMAELEEVYQTLPVNVNVLTICDDGATETDLAIQILEENGCNFDAIITNDEIYQNYLSSVTAFPTTIFVDKEGNVFGSKIEGAPLDPVSYYLAAAEEAMALLQE